MMKMTLFWLAMLGYFYFVPSAFARDDVAANAVYDRMSQAYAARDPKGLDQVFHPDLVSPPQNGHPPVIGGQDMIAMVGDGLARLIQKGRNVDLRFRITQRRWARNDLAIDLGVLAMTTVDSAGVQRTTYSRFLTVLTPQKDGQWSFVVDVPSAATLADWETATPAEGAKFD